MESLLKNLKKYVTCSLCSDTFTEPKTISCLHTFCCRCLQQYAVTAGRDGKLRCPECRAQISIPERNRFDGLPTGFLQNNFVDLLAVQQSSSGSAVGCGMCRKKSAESSFCFECRKIMCPDCVNAHELFRNVAFEGHKIKLVKFFQSEDYEAVLKRPSFCSQPCHEREVTRFFCIDCQTCVCQICIVTDHKNHAVVSVDKAADIEKAKVLAGAELMKEKRKVCYGAIHEFEETAMKLEDNIAAAKHEVSQTAGKMIAKIRERELADINALENTRVSRMEVINSAVSQVESLAKQMNQAIEFANNLIQRSSSSDLLQNKKDFELQFADLYKTPVEVVPVSPCVKFVPTTEIKNLTLGSIATIETAVEGLNQDFQAGVEAELVIRPKPTSKVQSKSQAEVVVLPAEKVRGLVTRKEAENLHMKFTPKVSGTYGIKVSVKGDYSQKSSFPIHVKDGRLKVVGELNLEGTTLQNPHGIAVNSNGLIAVADCNGHSILIFDQNGKYLRKLGSKGANAGELNYPTGVTFVSDDEILVADFLNNRIQQLNVHTGSYVNSFGRYGTGEGEFQNPVSVCMSAEGHVLVADCVNNRLQVLKRNGEVVLKIEGSGLGKLHHPTGCISHQNMFIVSDTYNNCLKVFDCSGKLLRQIGRKGNGDGELIRPQGLCVEKCGNHHNILVCDSGNGRIVQFSLEGYFTGKTVTKLQDPIAIAKTADGRILASGFEAKKVYILEL